MQVNSELIGIGAIIITLFTAWTKMRPAMQKIAADEDDSLRGDLLNRIKELEASVKEERESCKTEIEKIKAEHKSDIEFRDLRYDEVNKSYAAALKGFSDTINNLHTVLDGLSKNKG